MGRTGGGIVRVAALACAALWAGFGGLAFETAAVRRFGLLLGNTSIAAAVVVAAFLVGLGVGGFWAWRARWRRHARAAGLAYLGAAAGIVVADAAMAALGPLPFALGVPVALLLVGAPAVAMGTAFPLLFQGVRGRVGPGALAATNLLGSVVAAWLAGNVLVPEIGLGATAWIAALAYLVAGGAASAAGPAAAAPAANLGPPPSGLGTDVALAAASGVLVVGFQILLLRRLPFYLEGFQPTLSGVLASCLLAMSVGAVVGPAVLRRVAGPRGAAVALAFAAVGTCFGAQEWAAPAISRIAVSSDAGLHGRILLAALIAAGPAMVGVGAVVPTCLAGVRPERRASVAGLLFLAQGLGALAGALLVGHLAPWVFPTALFATTPVLLGVVGAVFACRAAPRAGGLALVVVVVLSAIGVAGAGTPLSPRPPVVGSRFDRPDAYRPISHRSDAVTTASVVYDRAHHSMVLFTDEFRAAYTGPGTSYMKVLGHLPFLLRDGLRNVAVIALGTGTTADAVRAWSVPETIDVVEISSAVLESVDAFAGDGPVPTGRTAAFLADPRTRVHVADGRRWLATRQAASLDLVTMEPLLPYAPGTAALYSAEFYQLVRSRLRSGGLCVQWVPTHAMPRETFQTLLSTFSDAFPSTSVWLVDQSTLLVGSAAAHLPDLDQLGEALRAAPPLARRTLHEAGIAIVDDLLAAHVGCDPGGTFPAAPRLHDDRPFLERIGYWSGEVRLSFYPGNLEALVEIVERSSGGFGSAAWESARRRRLEGLAARARAVLDPSGAAVREALVAAAGLRQRSPFSVLLHGEETLALRAAIEFEVRRMALASAAAIARRHVERDPASAILQAVAAADRSPGSPAAQAALAAAIAIDPTAPERAPWAFGWAAGVLPAERRSPLEDLSTLPVGEALVAMAAGVEPRAAAVRAMFGVRCALAFLEVARARPLSAHERAAFAEVVDPATFDALVSAVSERGGDLLEEVTPVWRRDLPMPRLLGGLLAGDIEARVGLARVLAGRKGRFATDALADLLEDHDLEVRRAAAGALYRSVGEEIRYDPLGAQSQRRQAADRLRELHNRRP